MGLASRDDDDNVDTGSSWVEFTAAFRVTGPVLPGMLAAATGSAVPLSPFAGDAGSGPQR